MAVSILNDGAFELAQELKPSHNISPPGLNGSRFILSTELESNSSLEEAEGPAGLLLCSWFVVMGVVLVGFGSNLIVIHAICFVKRFQRPQNFMLANLSITSVMTLFVYLIGNLLEQIPGIIHFSSATCGVLATVLQVQVPAEGLTIMFISKDRMRIVRRPLEKEDRSGAWRKIVSIWICSLLVTIPAGYLSIVYDPERTGSHFKCNWSYSILGSSVAYVIAQGAQLAAVVVIPSTVMLIDLIRLTNQLKFLVSCQGNEAPSGFLASRQRLIRISLAFTVVFILLRIPAGVSGFLYRLPPGLYVSVSLHAVVESWRKFWILAHMLQMAVNPLVIFALSTEIRQHLRSGLGFLHAHR